jgi:hypothetical protein
MSNRSSTDPHAVRPDDPIERARIAARRQREEREQQRAAELWAGEFNRLKLEWERRLIGLENGQTDLYGELINLAHTTREAIDMLVDAREDLSRERLEEIREMKAAIAKTDKLLDELRRGPAFQFAREKTGEVEDLPNPLAARRELN